MILTIPIWTDNPNEYLNLINQQKEKLTYVLLNCLNDIDYHRIGGDKYFMDNCLALCKDYNIKVILLTCYSEKFNPVLKTIDDRYDNFQKIEWPTYWIYRTFMLMLQQPNLDYNSNLNLCLLNKEVNLDTSVKYSYLSLNNLAKPHRSQLMDYLARDNLIDDGAIAWRDVIRGIDHLRYQIPAGMTDSEFCMLKHMYNYRYRYWKPKRLLLDQTDTHNITSQEFLPKEYNQCFMQLVPETADNLFLISEKTAVPLLFNKPFLVLSCKNYHKILESLGFQLYNEVFDYSFDGCDSLSDRVDGIVKNVQKIKNLSEQERSDCFNSIAHKLRHNRKIALEYVFDKVPQELLELSTNDSFMAIKTEISHIPNLTNIKQDVINANAL